MRLGQQQWIAVAAIGAATGWLVGHSASPVLGGVLTSVLGLAVGIVTGLRSVRRERAEEEPIAAAIDARPAAVLVVALALAATVAMVVKAHRLLEPAVLREAAWRAASQGQLDEVARADPHAALLFRVPQRECNALLSLKDNPEAFVGELRLSSLPGARRLADEIPDVGTLVTVVEVLCDRG